MHTSQIEERRFAQLPCNIDERRLQPYFYETLIYDQETETAREAQLKEGRAAPVSVR